MIDIGTEPVAGTNWSAYAGKLFRAVKEILSSAKTVTQSADNNDTANLQAALNGGGTVIIPNTGKDWRIGKVNIYRNTEVFAGSAVIKRRGLSYGMTNVTPGTVSLSDPADPYSGHGNIRIVGGIWDGNVVTETHTSTGFVVFYFAAARNISFEGVTIRDTVSNHCIDLNGVDGFSATRCNFLGFKDATVAGDAGFPHTYAEAIQVTQNMDTGDDAFLPAVGNPCRNVKVRDCVFGPSGTAGTTAYPCGVGTHAATNDAPNTGFSITGNTFNGCSYAAVRVYSYNDVKVTGNTFNGCAYGVLGSNLTNGNTWNKATNTWTTGGATRRQTSGITFTGNHLYDTVTADFYTAGTLADANGSWATMNDITVEHNKFLATTATRRTGRNVHLYLCREGTITSNQCYNGNEGILVDTSPDVTVANNTIRNTTGYGMRMVKSATPPGTDATYMANAVAKGNVIIEPGTNGIGMNVLHDFLAVGNKVTNWGAVTANSIGLMVSGSSVGLVSNNSIRATRTGTSNALAVIGSSTNVNVTTDNRLEKPDGALFNISGTGVTYGPLQYV